MANFSISYSAESPGGTILSARWNQNMADITNGLTDGTKDIIVANVNASAATLTRAVVSSTLTVNNAIVSAAVSIGSTLTVNNIVASAVISGATATFANLTAATTTVGALAANTCTVDNVVATNNVTGDYFLPTGDDTSAPAANRLYKANVLKAWAHLDVGAAGAVTVTDDHNISSASWSTQSLTVVIDTNMGNSTYAASGNRSTVDRFCLVTNYATTDFDLYNIDYSLGSAITWASGDDCECIVVGDQ